MNKTWKVIRTVLIFAVLAAAVVVYFVHLSKKTPGTPTESTAVQTDSQGNEKNPKVTSLTSRDLNLNYPGSPRAVVSYYSDLIGVLYKEEYGTEEFGEICDHIRGLFDEELLAYNPYDTYYNDLYVEAQAYKSVSKYISAYVLEDSYYEEHFTWEGNEYARLDVKYIMMENGKVAPKTYEKFTLRKDSSGNWKILFWTLTDPDQMNE